MMEMPQYMDQIEPNVVPCGAPCTTWYWKLTCIPWITLICIL